MLNVDREHMAVALRLACEEIVEISGSCPLDRKGSRSWRCDNCKDEYAKCWKEYFEVKSNEVK